MHRPRNPDPERLAAARWYDGSGRDLPASMAMGRIFSDYSRDNYQLVQLNHYALGAMQNYIVKADRGRANRAASGFDMSYWVERNFCEIEDRSITQLDSQDLRAELRADPQLAQLHQSGLAWRKARFETLMQDEAWRGLFGRLLLTPPSKTLSFAQAAPLLRYTRASPLG